MSSETGWLFQNVTPLTERADRPLCALAVDAEEDFDWEHPVSSTKYSTECMRNLSDLQSIAGAYGLRPTYLLTYPVLEDEEAVRGLQRYFARGECDLGLQLHPWVTPPLEGPTTIDASFAGNLAPELEERKLLVLKGKFEARFGFSPTVYRAGRYGLGPFTAALLERHGFEVDVSLAPRTRATSEGGPDFQHFDCTPFWFGAHRRILELPLCRSLVGWGGRPAFACYQSLSPTQFPGPQLTSMLTRARAAERLTLSPEGNDFHAMSRLVHSLVKRRQAVMTVSLHSSSLALGRSPYVRSRADLHGLYDRLSGILSLLSDTIAARFTHLSDIPRLLRA